MPPVHPRPIRPLFRALAWPLGLAFAASGALMLGLAALAAVQGEWRQVWAPLILAAGGAGIAVRLLPAAWTGLDLAETEDVFEEEEAPR